MSTWSRKYRGPRFRSPGGNYRAVCRIAEAIKRNANVCVFKFFYTTNTGVKAVKIKDTWGTRVDQ